MSVAEARPQRLRVAVAGATGRMGRMLVEAIRASDDMTLSGALDLSDLSVPGGASDVGDAATARGIAVTSDVRAGLAGAQVLIDFTRPEGTLAHLAVCGELGVNVVVGTTGFDAAQKAQIEGAAERIAIVFAPNMSVGVNVVLKLLEVAGGALDDGWDVEVVETHHRHKVDAPSGTALKMGEVVAAAQGKRLDDRAPTDRDGARRPGSIGFASLRGGDIVGDHTVLFAGSGERIEITHRATSRATYVDGSLRAARFLAGRRSGLFGMGEVLGLGAESTTARQARSEAAR